MGGDSCNEAAGSCDAASCGEAAGCGRATGSGESGNGTAHTADGETLAEPGASPSSNLGRESSGSGDAAGCEGATIGADSLPLAFFSGRSSSEDIVALLAAALVGALR